jgi:hypothetical protein
MKSRHYLIISIAHKNLNAWVIIASMFLLPYTILAQTTQGSSLADVARQMRAQKGDQGATTGQAQQIADELSEDQNDNGAPGGFKTYNTGDYKIWVPAPYHVDGHDSTGVVLSGPMVGTKHPIVLLGTPIVAHFPNNDDAAFQDTALQFSHLYAQSATCTKATVANHSAYECGLSVATMLGQRVTGNAVFVHSLGSIYPVFCAAPSDSGSRDWMNNARNATVKTWAQKGLEKDDDDVKSVFQKCETVFQSIQIPEGVTAQNSAANRNQAGDNGVKRANSNPAQASANSTGANSATATSPASAPAEKSTTTQPAIIPSTSSVEATSAVPAGSKAYPFTYCTGPQHCWSASVLIPSDAKLVSSDCKQSIFETKVQGVPFLLMVGPAACEVKGGPDTVSWKQLTDPESKRPPGTFSTISSQVTKLDGKPATITTIGFRKGLDSWMGKRAEVESNGVVLVVGCLAPRDNFADGDTICTTLIESLQMP